MRAMMSERASDTGSSRQAQEVLVIGEGCHTWPLEIAAEGEAQRILAETERRGMHTDAWWLPVTAVGRPARAALAEALAAFVGEE